MLPQNNAVPPSMSHAAPARSVPPVPASPTSTIAMTPSPWKN
jgi:hypothetical protein